MKSRMIEEFVKSKQEEINLLKQLEAGTGLPLPYQGPRPGLRQALTRSGPRVIAEYKRASPSRGVINSGIFPHEAAEMFVRGGADAFSVLTEKRYFQGAISFVDIFAGNGLPVLRKDFVFHPLQIIETAATMASAVLLIVRIFQEQGLLMRLVEMSLGYDLEPVVEIFSREELETARKSGARTILVNNRDLDTLSVNLDVSRKLIKEKHKNETWICASGIENKSQVDELYSSGFDAFLIGTSIMSSGDPEARLRELKI